MNPGASAHLTAIGGASSGEGGALSWGATKSLTATRVAGRLNPATRLEVRACILPCPLVLDPADCTQGGQTASQDSMGC